MNHSKAMLRAGTAILLSLSVAACSSRASDVGGGGTSTTPVTPTPTPTPTASFQSRFGTAFAALFDASTTSEPRKPTTADVPALSLTTEPLDN